MIKPTFKPDKELEALLEQSKKKGLKFGLALGSGSARGMAHIGVIETLEAYHIPIDMIAGTSMGALIGSIYASGVPIKKIKRIAMQVKKRAPFIIFDPTLPFSGLVSGKRIDEMLEKIALKNKSFSDLKIPFAAISTDLTSGAKVILNQGSVLKAVRASISIPGIFIPVKYQERYLVDGGIVDPVPVDVVEKMGADFIMAVSLSNRNPRPLIMMIDQETGGLNEVNSSNRIRLNLEELSKLKDAKKIASLVEKEVATLGQKITGVKKKFEGPHLIEIISKSLDIMEREIASLRLNKADVVIIPNEIEKIGLFEFDKTDQCIKAGQAATLTLLPQIKQAIKKKLKQKAKSK
ncbi:MAG: hypothetical protein Kow00103_11910 [Candidatus Caldatribacteriota bacterium]